MYVPCRNHAVYPRWRGEHISRLIVDIVFTGLSPLARGTLLTRSKTHGGSRFIPAGAGNTLRNSRCHSSGPVYPRWRGEHPHFTLIGCFFTGLSPLARGTRQPALQSEYGTRFIPAGAGNTFRWLMQPSGQPVYPRWRGEHRTEAVTERCTLGLSPLARGTRLLHLSRCRLSRFIPAGAGNTRLRLHYAGLPAVYPRWRGEHIRSLSQVVPSVGLSPLARGTQAQQKAVETHDRFIPAGAGNTRAMVADY